MIADSQVHIWAASTPQRPWPVERSAFAHGPATFGAKDILAAMDAGGIDRAVLVPAMCEGDRNDVALAAAKSYPGRFAVMGRVTLNDPLSRKRIEREISEDGMLGLRLTFVGNEAHLLTDGSANWVWDLAEERAVPVMVIAPGQLEMLGQIASARPAIKMAIDHLGLTPHEPARAAVDFSKLLALAAQCNVSVKASGFGWLHDEEYPFRSFLDRTRRAIDEFGAERIFWGTDFTRLKCSYRQTVAAFEDHLGFRNDVERRLVMGEALCNWLRWR